MINILLQAIPLQTFSIRLENHLYDITLRDITEEIMTCTIVRDSIVLQSNIRAIPAIQLLPYQYQEADGNFYFITSNDAYPYWPQFNITQTLVWASLAEINAILNSVVAIHA